MKSVHRFRITNPRKERLKLITAPKGFQPLRVDIQDEDILLWALVDVDDTNVEMGYVIRLTMTGLELPAYISKKHYIGTVIFPDGQDIHVFWDNKD